MCSFASSMSRIHSSAGTAPRLGYSVTSSARLVEAARGSSSTSGHRNASVVRSSAAVAVRWDR